uniref:Uncharacterized protein n=1 Tax=Nelumbo nucifera TaxID=4432 RepID=A0A822ZU17_NELNU|nr:TPA_asm: hypothetical protein HUJ06_017997 [Nelumbo nucifera]
MEMGRSSSCTAGSSTLFLFCFFVSMGLSLLVVATKEKYIVYMGQLPHHQPVDVPESHHKILTDALGSSEVAKERIMHSYTRSFNGFVANLTEDEARKLSETEGVVSVFKSGKHKLHTTKAWDFLGFSDLLVKRDRVVESNIIVGVLDSGINMQSECFSDTNLGPPPAKWKGTCGPFDDFTCNKKIIGARWFKVDKNIPAPDVASPVDYRGHGSHTASIIAGRVVEGANFFGLAAGDARGAVPSARIAVYKVCYVDGYCSDEDILAAFDHAIADGVDIINLSVGEDPGYSVTDAIAIGSFHAMQKRILTIASAGNDGPLEGSVVNFSPWMLTVGATTTDRQFMTRVVLDNGNNLTGISVNTFDMANSMYPLIRGSDAVSLEGTSVMLASRCVEGSLNVTLIKDKIVFCLTIGGPGKAGEIISEGGGSGAIMQVSDIADTPEVFSLPVTVLGEVDGKVLSDYIENTQNPQATIYKSEEIQIPAPFVASFSSRGPNPVYQNILKPDLVAPGKHILAASTLKTSVTGKPNDKRFSNFLLRSGTSMAAPFAAGAAAYIKSLHPTWSPAAIKSALMTTTKAVNMSFEYAKLRDFAYGAGQIDPLRAADPGLVTYAPPSGRDDLNYPSILFPIRNRKKPSEAVYWRTVTNVDNGPAEYTATVLAPAGVEIIVEPLTLKFSRQYENQIFKVTVRVPASNVPPYVLSASLEWKDNVHTVRSPIVIYFT